MNSPRWKGMFITKKQYERRAKQREAGFNSRKRKLEENSEKCIVEGRRIIDVEVMSQHLSCTSCKETLSLKDILKEDKKGLASIFLVECSKCLKINSVPTSSQHLGPTGKSKRFDTNTRAALGCIHTGLGCDAMNKLLNVMDVPGMPSVTFKRHEREIGPVIEDVAKSSCNEACIAERSLTLANLEKLKKVLPNSVGLDFLVPQDTTSTSCEAFDTVTPTEANKRDQDKIVRVFGSYDMGWSKRGTGHQYDSLNGYSSLIGQQSGRVLDYATRNRKCRKCDKGHPKDNHDCQLNFQGTAKAMEADAAVELVTNSSVLKENNIQVGVFIGDNDSSSICAIRKASTHTVVKHADKNHTSKGVTNLLYKIGKAKDPEREMTPEAIKYLHKCFTYAMAQNQGNTDKMAAAIKNIPYHVFDKHEGCGDWCRYWSEKENYKHRTISGGFRNSILFAELKTTFENLANNAHKFSAGASSQANESLNGVMSKKAPKAQCYSLSESADFRFASAVAQKNRGETYVQDALTKCGLSPGPNLTKLIERVNRSALRRSTKAKTPAFKLNRRLLQKKRSLLKNKKESIEGQTYSSHMGLIDEPSEAASANSEAVDLSQVSTRSNAESGAMAIICFDLETSGFEMSCDILQIALKCGKETFNKYVDPSQSISAMATRVHGLTNVEGELHLRGVRVASLPIRVVLGELMQYLKSFDKPCVLVAHNCKFDAPRLIKKIQETSLLDDFKKVIAGFVDTLPLFRKKFPERRGKGMCTLTTLATETLQLPSEGAHDANYDVEILEKLINHHFKPIDIVNSIETLTSVLQLPLNKSYAERIVNALQPLEMLSKVMKTRMANAGITYENLLLAYKKSESDAIEILQKKENGKAQVIKTKKMLNNILQHLKQVTKI